MVGLYPSSSHSLQEKRGLGIVSAGMPTLGVSGTVPNVLCVFGLKRMPYSSRENQAHSLERPGQGHGALQQVGLQAWENE